MSELENCCGTTCDKSKLSDFINKLIAENDTIKHENHQLKESNDALAAQVNSLRDALQRINEYWNRDTNEQAMLDACQMAEEESGAALNSSSSKCLAERYAEVAAKAVEDFYKALMRSPNISISGKEIIAGIYLCRPDPLRQQTKGGE